MYPLPGARGSPSPVPTGLQTTDPTGYLFGVTGGQEEHDQLRGPAFFLYWVGSLDLNFLVEIKGFSIKPPKSQAFCRAGNSNPVLLTTLFQKSGC